jgi:hypothetical protein
MIKLGEFVVIVDSVEEVLSYYTDKLYFDLECLDIGIDDEGKEVLASATVRKGKCIISFRKPKVEELAEFSFIKRCTGRSTGILLESSIKEFDKLFLKYKKKGLPVVQGNNSFYLKDPVGIKIMFFKNTDSCFSKDFIESRYNNNLEKNSLLDSMEKDLKKFGITRRVAKKFCNYKLKKRNS